VVELLLAILLGGAIGLERELRDKPAGLRTHILICMGATLFANLAQRVAGPGGDPGRLAGHIVAGVGFIGAGTILHQGGTVSGLTTAANIWVVAAIGMTLGFGGYLDATVAAFLVVVVLTALSQAERLLDRKVSRHDLYVAIDPEAAPVSAAVAPLIDALRGAGVDARLLGVRHDKGGRVAHLEVHAGLDDDDILRTVLALPGVRGAHTA
jgi:putative Mg2+ transporter-C (MgtC) family protein